jgi:hypothetical protein
MELVMLHPVIVTDEPMVRFVPSVLYDITVRGLLQKLACILAVVFIVIGLLPSRVIGQNAQTPSATADQVRLTDAERRLDRLDQLPERTATIEAGVAELRAQVDTLSTRAWLILAAACAALLDRLLSVFGIKIRDRNPTT